jgi:hypothetical protein
MTDHAPLPTDAEVEALHDSVFTADLVPGAIRRWQSRHLVGRALELRVLMRRNGASFEVAHECIGDLLPSSLEHLDSNEPLPLAIPPGGRRQQASRRARNSSRAGTWRALLRLEHEEGLPVADGQGTSLRLPWPEPTGSGQG